MLCDDVKTVDEIIEAGCGSNIVAAWGRIKNTLEAAATSHNKQSTPCCICDEATNAQAKVICECCVGHYYE